MPIYVNIFSHTGQFPQRIHQSSTSCHKLSYRHLSAELRKEADSPDSLGRISVPIFSLVRHPPLSCTGDCQGQGASLYRLRLQFVLCSDKKRKMSSLRTPSTDCQSVILFLAPPHTEGFPCVLPSFPDSFWTSALQIILFPPASLTAGVRYWLSPFSTSIQFPSSSTEFTTLPFH